MSQRDSENELITCFPGLLNSFKMLTARENIFWHDIPSRDEDHNECTLWMTFWHETTLQDSSSSDIHMLTEEATKKRRIQSSHRDGDSVSTSSVTTCSVAAPSPEKKKQKKPQVSFDTVSVRVYSITLGDHPSSTGAPLSLDWDYEQVPPMDLNEYEYHNQKSRRKPIHVLSKSERKNILLKLGYSKEEIKRAKKEVSRVQRQRRTTELFLPMFKIEEAVSAGRRKVQRSLRPLKDMITV
jgi:hypothetical protein